MLYVNNPIQQTWFFGLIFIAALLLSIKFVKKNKIFPHSVTQELKGFAILAIIFAHIGYILSSDQRFLWPFSIMAGVGVNLYLFLSGYGLSMSNLKKPLSPIKFYKKRLISLYMPFWIILILFIILDFVLLGLTYSLSDMLKAGLGVFQTADINWALNSPLWFFTLIIAYYLIFPLIFMKKKLWLSAIILMILGCWLVYSNLAWMSDINRLYKVHYLAFPLGMLLAWLVSGKNFVSKKFNLIFIKLKLFFAQKSAIGLLLYGLFILALIILVGYGGYHSFAGSGTYKEQLVSLLVMFGILLLFVFKKIQLGLLYIFGLYSYEIYLLHWPIISRYDFLYPYMPAWLATVIYLAIFLILGYLLSFVTDQILIKSKIKSPSA
jgi:peptidoglycan/LPS O-acetylase OafA/YrhL